MAGFVRSRDFVRVHTMPFGPQILPENKGTLFRLWAPSAEKVELLIENHPVPMEKTGNGWYASIVPEAGHSALYQFRIDDNLLVPDPASRFQPEDVHGPSQVIDPVRFEWKDHGWQGRPWEEAIIYELHVGTFSPEGTFRGVQNRLDTLFDLGITAIELMPVADFPGKRNWGYDGVLPFAPDSRYGTPDELKELVQSAHQKGLMVFLDVVYNHFGPEGNYLHAYAAPFFTHEHSTPWGDAINFGGSRALLAHEGRGIAGTTINAGEKAGDDDTGSVVDSASVVRDFFIQNALYWLNEYHFDGLRLDAVHAIHDQSDSQGAGRHFLAELAETIRANVDPNRHVHLILENDDNAVRFLDGDSSRAYTAQWNDDFHHAMHVLMTGESSGYYGDYAKKPSQKSPIEHLARCLTEGFAYQGEHSSYRHDKPRGEHSGHLHPVHFVNFLQNHDQIGNRAFGERLLTLTSATRTNQAYNKRFTSLPYGTPPEHGLTQTAELSQPEAMRAALAVLLLAPSVPLIFMGEEWGTERPFLFFCDFNANLASQVREGRRQEFSRFPQFSNPANRQRIPDPGAVKTFTDSCLDWNERQQPRHEVWFRFYKNLLTIRKQEIIPLLSLIPSQGETFRSHQILGPVALSVQWKLTDGRTLMLAANLGAEPLTFHPGDHHNLKLVHLTLVYQSGDQVLTQLQSGYMPAWSVVWCMQ